MNTEFCVDRNINDKDEIGDLRLRDIDIGDWFSFKPYGKPINIESIGIKTNDGYQYLVGGQHYGSHVSYRMPIQLIKKITKLEWEV
jgi:hypothetical protein